MFMRRRDVLGGLAIAAVSFPVIAQSVKPKTLRVIKNQSLGSIDPIWTTAAATIDLGFMVFDELLGVDANYVPKAQMVEGWSTEDDGKVYIFKLREGLKFHDGEPVRAVDCVESIRRWSVRDVAGQSVAAATNAMDVIDDHSFRIRLKTPFPLLLDSLAKLSPMPCFIMPERIAKTDPFKQIGEAIGSGPFKFLKDEWVSGQRAVFAKFDDYLPRSEPASGLAGGRVVKVDRIEWSFISDAATAAAAMQSGEQDYWDIVPPDLVPLLKQSGNLNVGPRLTSGVYYTFVMNHLQVPFNNPAIRQALAMGVDQSTYLMAATGGIPEDGGTCTSFYTCDSPNASDAGAEVLKQRNVAKAAAALKAAGYAGEKVVFIGASDPPALAAITQVSDDLLRRIGFNVEFVATDFAGMIQRRVNKDTVEKGGWSAFNSTYGGIDMRNPAINALLRGAGPNSWFGWPTNPRLEELRSQWFVLTNADEKVRVAREIQVEAFKTLPYIPLCYSSPATAWSKKLTGVTKGPIATFWDIGKLD
jgi:peptide/nickel transport system substrate-binding protein